jgi:hypothetical protein
MHPTIHTLGNPLEWGTIEIVQFDEILLDEESNMQSESSSTVVDDAEIKNVGEDEDME